MNPEELEKMKQEIKAEVVKELTGKSFHSPQKQDSAFNQTRTKWAKNGGPLYQQFGTYYYAKAWDLIRTLSVMCVGVRYQRELTPIKAAEAAEIAEFLCQYVIEKKSGVKPCQGG